MDSRILRSLVLVAMCACAAVASACAAAAVPPPVSADGYVPRFYDGYVVYYDDVGRPFYYAEAGRTEVPIRSPQYARLVQEWRLEAPAYRQWYVDYGFRYRGFRYADQR